MTQPYECVHVPLAGVKLLTKNWLLALAVIAAAFIIHNQYGTWPFIVLIVLAVLFAVFMGILMFNANKPEPQKIPGGCVYTGPERGNCVVHPEIPASNSFRVSLPSGEMKDIQVCASCVPGFINFINQKTLTAGS